MTAENIQRLKVLTDRYYEALSTPDEEREMRDLLNDPSLPAEYLPVKEMMAHMDAVAVPDGFESRMESLIDRLEAEASEHEAEENRPTIRSRSAAFRAWGIAASVAMLMCVGVGFMLGRNHEHPGSDLTPEQTYAEVNKALGLFASTVERGCEKMERTGIPADAATEKAWSVLARLTGSQETD
ncbi:MAG: hypothetical protein NC349_04535 [Paenibacillus sp.]|nr:hypothetical protein [Paenibacillus sp.]